jgi:hypothetical protein
VGDGVEEAEDPDVHGYILSLIERERQSVDKDYVGVRRNGARLSFR